MVSLLEGFIAGHGKIPEDPFLAENKSTYSYCGIVIQLKLLIQEVLGQPA